MPNSCISFGLLRPALGLFDLDAPLDHVGQDGLHLVLAGVHGAALRALPVQVDGVEGALGGADAAADALVGVHDAGAAAQAAGRLGLDLLGGEGHALVPEGPAQGVVVADALLRRQVIKAAMLPFANEN